MNSTANSGMEGGGESDIRVKIKDHFQEKCCILDVFGIFFLIAPFNRSF